MRLFTLTVFFIFGFVPTALAQPPCSSIPGMTPQTAIPVCGTTVFNQTSVASCQGPPISGTGACGGTNASDNAFWYKFHCYQSGTLGFMITPVVLSDDYDWELFDVTRVRNLNQVYTDESLMVSLNLCGDPNGATGCAPAGVDSINCGGPTNLINRMATLTAGNDYMLMVNNWSNSGFGYNLSFGPGSAVITDPTAPEVNSAETVGCNSSELKVVFNKDILCSSVTATGSEFSILPAGPVITGIVSACASSASTITEMTVLFQNPLPAGNYDLVINPGTDGNTFKDVCGNDIVTGFTIPFTVASIPPLEINSVSFPGCGTNLLKVAMSKPFLCNSLTATGSEFSISPGAHVITSVQSACNASAVFADTIIIVLQDPLLPGNYQLNINNGTDGNTLMDTCSILVPAGYFETFTAPALQLPEFDSVQVDNCDPGFIKVFYDRPILCSSVSPNGSDYSVTGPSSVTITAATTDVTCTSGYTNWVRLQFAAPVNTVGTYILHNGIGIDGNGILDTCLASQNTAETIAFDMLLKPSAVFNSQVNWGCSNDTLILSHPGGNGINSWIWNFSTGGTASGQNVTHIVPVTTPSVDVQLIVSNGFCSDTTTTTITLGNFLKAGFTNNPLDSFCINSPVIFTDTSRGNLVDYLWDFGDLSQYNGQTPPTHAYPISQNYTVKLTVTDIDGCKDSAIKVIHVTPTADIDFTGLNPQYCTGNKLQLRRKISPNIISYIWDNGDGKTFENKVDVVFSYPVEGTYTITLTGIDKYCGTATVSKTIPVYQVPVVELPGDTILCKTEQLLIGVSPTANYTYLWSTGATSPQIRTDIFSRNYRLTAENNGCKGYDEMAVKVLSVCLIKVPGAFTPNRDGLNDQLKALNADLATNFSFKVFNRVGQVVFSTNNPLEGWDGIFKSNPAETGTYVWVLSYTDPWTGEQVNTKGASVLLR